MPHEPPQSPGKTASGQPRKPRTKSFSGCWTCRAKHVKCDEAKPECNRCLKAGIECEGYGVRISWASDGPSSNGFDESDQGDGPSHEGSSDLPSEAQSTSTPFFLDQNLPLSQGPFTDHLNTRIFHSYELLGQGLTTGPPYASLQTAQPQLPMLQLFDQNSIPQDGINTHSTSTPISLGDVSTGSLPLPGVSELVSQTSSPVNTPDQRRKITRHLDILPDPALHCELLQHWTLSLCDSLNPVPGALNPLRSAMMPIALEGSRTDSEKSTGATALFHFICSASAFHLAKKRECEESKGSLENVALEHHNIGITHLAQNIRHSKNGTDCVSLLASIIMCIYNEAVTLPTTFWRLHFRGAVEWVNHIDPQVWHRSDAASSLYQMFRSMATVVQTQLLFDNQETSYWHFTNDLGPQPEPYTLYESFGLPQPIFEGLRAMNSLQIRKRSSTDSDPSPDELDRLELELYLSAPNKPDTSTAKEYAELIYNHGCIFYYAALIHMKRNLKDMPMDAVRPLVEKALPHLEALPSAFEIADTAMQQRMLKSLAFFEERSDLAIWSQITHLVKELWALRKREGANIKWHQTALG
ncbi:hypothetical protein IL306_010498, partial [Fusarium sp. DS 682]